MFIENKYLRWYQNIIKNRQDSPLSGYVEKHHIIPKSLGGTNKKSNLVSLSAREHYVCHRLLVKFTTGQDKVKMSFALRNIVSRENKYQTRHKITSRAYALIIETTRSIIGQAQTGPNNPYYGKTHSAKVKAIMKAKRALQEPPLLGKTHSAETKEKLRLANKNQFQDPLQIELRKKHTLEQMKDPARRLLAGNGKRGKKWYYCPHTKHCSLFFPNSIPDGYIEGRIIKK
jgi:hypothetical protein